MRWPKPSRRKVRATEKKSASRRKTDAQTRWLRQLESDFASLHGAGEAFHLASNYDPGEGKRIELLGSRGDDFYVTECLGRRTPRDWLTHVLIQSQLLFEQLLDGTLQTIVSRLKELDVEVRSDSGLKPNAVKRQRIRFVVLANKFSSEFLNLVAALKEHYQFPVECFVPRRLKGRSPTIYEFKKVALERMHFDSTMRSLVDLHEGSGKTLDADSSVVSSIEVHPSGFIEEIWDEAATAPGYTEREIEEWLISNMDELTGGLRCVSRQQQLGPVGDITRVDILALDNRANFHLLELKRDCAHVLALVQLLDYASRFRACRSPANDLLLGTSPEELFRACFDTDPPRNELRVRPQLAVIAPGFSEDTVRLAVYLNRVHLMQLSLYAFEVEKGIDGALEFPLRRIVAPESELNIRFKPSQTWVMRWDDSQRPTWDKWITQESRLPLSEKAWELFKTETSGERIPVIIYLSGNGYVGFGHIELPRSQLEVGSEGIVLVPFTWEFRLERERAVFRRHFPQPESELERFENTTALELIFGLLWTRQHRNRKSKRTRYGSDRRKVQKKRKNPSR